VKKSTLIIAALTVLAWGVVQAEEGLQDGEGTPVGSTSAPKAPPMLLAASFPAPAVKPSENANPVHRLPGMSSPQAPVDPLPQPLVTDFSNAPNPFDSRRASLAGQTQISYQLAKDAKVSLEIFDLLGHKVCGWTYLPGMNGGRQGANTLLWDGTNASGQKVSKGGYLAEIVIETPETTVTAIRKIGVIH
jgi:hypothetical protein